MSEDKVLNLDLEEKAAEQTRTPEEHSYLTELVGEGKKFATVEEAVNALAKKAKHADEFIETLKNEKRDIEQEVVELRTKSKTAEEIVNIINSRSAPAQEKAGQDANPAVAQSLPTKEDIAKLVGTVLTEKELSDKRKANMDSSVEKLNSITGSLDVTKKVIAQYIGQDADKRALVNSLGSTDPNALVSIMERFMQDINFTADGGGSSRIEDHSAKPKVTITWTEAKKIKKESPAVFNSIAFQQKLNAAVQANPNFYRT